MNQEPPAQPAEFCIRRMLGDLKQFAHREPGQAMAAAVGVGVLINLLPPRLLAGTVTVVGATLVHPLLLSLGVTKAIELCCQNTSTKLPE